MFWAAEARRNATLGNADGWTTDIVLSGRGATECIAPSVTRNSFLDAGTEPFQRDRCWVGTREENHVLEESYVFWARG